jgi:hypothetical protein
MIIKVRYILYRKNNCTGQVTFDLFARLASENAIEYDAFHYLKRVSENKQKNNLVRTGIIFDINAKIWYPSILSN